MKTWLKALLISGACIIGTTAVVIPILGIVGAFNVTAGIISGVIKPETPTNPDKPEKPTSNIPLPTLNSVKNNYHVNSLSVDVNKAKQFPSQQPISTNSNIYDIELSSLNLSNIFDSTSNTLYFSFDPMLSSKDDDINVYFHLLNGDNSFDFSKVNNIVFYIKKIPETLLSNNFMKKMVFNLSSSSSPFLSFDHLKNFIIYEEEQSCFKAPSNYVRLNTNSLPVSVTNIYSDASFYRVSFRNETNVNLIMPDLSSYTNLEKLIFDVNNDEIYWTPNPEMSVVFAYFYRLYSGMFSNANKIKIYSSFSFGFDSYDSLLNFNQHAFGKLNPNYTGYKIPYYLNYVNPLSNLDNQVDTGTFPVPKDKNSDIYKVFEWDDYYKKTLSVNNYATSNFINKELNSIAKVSLPIWWKSII